MNSRRFSVVSGRISATLLVVLLALAGCEYFGSDVATRIRYALGDAKAELQKSGKETLTVKLRPNHFPDSCGNAPSYRVTLSPYKGGKQVPVGDIAIDCKGSRQYHTGFGSTDIYVMREMAVEKKADDELRITLRKAAKGVEIVALE